MTQVLDVQARVPVGRIDLGVGQPDHTLLPLQQLRLAAAKRLEQNDPSLLAYGVQQGGDRFRETFANFLSEATRTAVQANRLFVVAGASHGIDLVCRTLSQPGDTILVEKPSYFCALKIFQEHGLNLIPAPTDAHGLITDALPELAKQYRPKFIYTIPTYQNPLGVTLPADRRRALVDAAATYDFHILADEVYQLLNYDAEAPLPMSHYDPQLDRVVSVSAFTKILAPGLRLGWIEANADLCQQFANSGVQFSGGGTSPFTSEIVRTCIEGGLLTSYLGTIKDTFLTRAKLLYNTLRNALPDKVQFERPTGGYFIWMKLPSHINAADLLPNAHAAGVGYRAGPLFCCDGGMHDCLRVGFTFYGDAELVEGGNRLCRVLNQALR